MFSPTDVVATIRHATEVQRKSKWSDDENISYDLVVSILRHQKGYTEKDAHKVIFEAVMAGVVVLAVAKERSTDREESLCLDTEVDQ